MVRMALNLILTANAHNRAIELPLAFKHQRNDINSPTRWQMATAKLAHNLNMLSVKQTMMK